MAWNAQHALLNSWKNMLPHTLGSALREVAFLNGDGYGFWGLDIRADASPMQKEKISSFLEDYVLSATIEELALAINPELILADVHGHTFSIKFLTIEVAWEVSSEGFLCFRIADDRGKERVISCTYGKSDWNEVVREGRRLITPFCF